MTSKLPSFPLTPCTRIGFTIINRAKELQLLLLLLLLQVDDDRRDTENRRLWNVLLLPLLKSSVVAAVGEIETYFRAMNVGQIEGEPQFDAILQHRLSNNVVAPFCSETSIPRPVSS